MVDVCGSSVLFRFYRPDAQSVEVVGDFNRWRLHELRMNRGPDGTWSLAIELPAGSHRFRYVVDGCEWYADYAAFGVEYGPFGADSIVRVSDAPHRSVA
jgi:1,4-alpha-glucan branching enzyme